MWPEPLTPRTRRLDEHNLIAEVLAGDGAIVATAPYVVNVTARTGAFGTMEITDERGAPRQRVRALVLLVREALGVANDLGLVDVHTRAPARLAAFAERFTGPIAPRLELDTLEYRGDLAQIRSRALDETDATGAYTRPRPGD